jgi:hypothetical protein
MDIELIRNFDIYTPPQDAMLEYPDYAIPEHLRNHNPPLPPKAFAKDNPQENDTKFNGIAFYLK